MSSKNHLKGHKAKTMCGLDIGTLRNKLQTYVEEMQEAISDTDECLAKLRKRATKAGAQ